jgi:phage terminase large subunit GpA-like protein
MLGGTGEESWRVDFELMPGDPASKAPWADLAKLIGKRYPHESGASMPVSMTFVDTGGHHASRPTTSRAAASTAKVFAIKGSSLQEGVPLLGKPYHLEHARVITYQVGSFTGKEVLMTRLAKIDVEGPGYIHLPDDIDYAHLEQFLNEKLVTQPVKGRFVRRWVKEGPNEQIDLWVYAYAALHALGPMVFRRLALLAQKLAESAKPKVADPPPPRPGPPILHTRPRKGYVDWK